MWRRAFVAVLYVLLPLAFGCGGSSYDGPKRVPVSGTVNFDGQLLQEGNIFFVPDEEGLRNADGVIGNGTFDISEEMGPNVGKYKVRIISYAGSSENEDAGESEEGAGETDELMTGDVEQTIPSEYNEQTTLTADIKEGMEPLKFDLTK